jgi:hypothetical protein
VHMVGRHSLLSLACARRKVQLLAGQYVGKLQATEEIRADGEAMMKHEREQSAKRSLAADIERKI